MTTNFKPTIDKTQDSFKTTRDKAWLVESRQGFQTWEFIEKLKTRSTTIPQLSSMAELNQIRATLP